jgi:hypothetical protein
MCLDGSGPEWTIGPMAWLSDVWGWGGWLVVALVPLLFWAFLAVLLVLVFRRRPLRAIGPSRQPALTARRAEGSALSWRPPVPSHH